MNHVKIIFDHELYEPDYTLEITCGTAVTRFVISSGTHYVEWDKDYLLIYEKIGERHYAKKGRLMHKFIITDHELEVEDKTGITPHGHQNKNLAKIVEKYRENKFSRCSV